MVSTSFYLTFHSKNQTPTILGTQSSVFTFKRLENVTNDLEEHYQSTESFYKERKSTYEKNMELFKKLSDNENAEPLARLIGTLSSAFESNFMVSLSTHMFILNCLIRLTLVVQMSIATIENEIKQLRQPSILPNEKDSERMLVLEQELSKLKQMSEQWQPIMGDIKKAFEKTEKYFDANR